MFKLIVYSTLILQLSSQIDACPDFCTCKWKSGKQTVECINKDLSDIPNGLDPSTQVLDFSGNSLQLLQDELFSKKQLINLQRIYLVRCNIRKISEKTFRGLSNLVELDLSHNLLDSVPTVTFLDYPSLMRLTLSSNPLKILKRLAFNHLSYLNTLELSNCELEKVEEGAFQGLHSLEWLLLDKNRLKTIPGAKTLPENLKGVEFEGNVWECDCHIQDFHIWLRNFKIPFSVDPVCSGPPRLAKRVIKSIPATELACLPDISPTSFYLELAEGRNISLQCHVHAVPEASISWWFQGQILQNNSMIAPGLHLIYFVEEGAENKRSELFIYNANREDNGTFICNAENAAGTSLSNFTIRVIIKEDPVVVIVAFPFEYLLVVVIGAAILSLLVVIVIVIGILKCRHKRRREENHEKAKSLTVQYDQDMTAKLREEAPTSDPLKTGNKNSDVEMMLYATHTSDELSVISPASNQLGSPSSYQQEQNPDLINGTQDCHLYQNQDTISDVRWNPMDSKGYPIDYGLPKIPSQNENYYRTLPSSRIKRHSAANPASRYSQEAEFLASRNPHFDHFHNDIRYTADGYPARIPGPAIQAYPCCSVVQWPPCLPASLHPVTNQSKRCVSAQTDNDGVEKTSRTEPNNLLNDALTESPDEGYEGEPSVV